MTAGRRPIAVCAIVMAAAIAGCATPPPEAREADRAVRERIVRTLGVIPPLRSFEIYHADDGGSTTVVFVDSRGEKLTVWQNNRTPPARLTTSVRTPDPNLLDLLVHRPLYLGQPPDPQAVRLPWGSPAESAVVDLAWSAARSLLTPEQESLLVREDAWEMATGDRDEEHVQQMFELENSVDERALPMRRFARAVAWRRDFVLEGGQRLAPVQKRERIRRELGLSPPYTLLSAGHAPDGGTGIAHFTDAAGHPLWVFVDASMYWPGIEQGVPPPVRYVYVNERQDREDARQLAFSSPGESAVVDLMNFVLADESSRRLAARMRPEDSREQLGRIVRRTRGLPAEALKTRAMFLESTERLPSLEKAQ